MAEIQQILDGIPDKKYYRIGEVAKITALAPYVLRYWETEFKTMAPLKSRSNQRMYRRKDIEAILKIKHLLRKRGFTIAGARQYLQEESRGRAEADAADRPSTAEALQRLRSELVELRELLASS